MYRLVMKFLFDGNQNLGTIMSKYNKIIHIKMHKSF